MEIPGILLLPSVARYVEGLATALETIDEPRRSAGLKLAQWIVARYRSNEPIHVIVICTGNSRRSSLGATMGNIAATYFGMPEIRFSSGGTEHSTFNHRTIKALEEIGLVIEPTGEEAARGQAGAENPVYRVRWGQKGLPVGESFEFSKSYDDPSQPASGFAAVMVCNEADESCPVVKGASARISMPFHDPKVFDDTSQESQMYAERRDEIGRVMMAVISHVRGRLVLGTEDF